MLRANKNNSNKLFLTLGIISISLFFLFGTKTIRADECGPNSSPSKPVCECGDTVMGDYTLPDNLVCTDYTDGLILGASDITINGDHHTITGFGAGSGEGPCNGINTCGIEEPDGSHINITIENLNITNFDYGIYFYNAIDSPSTNYYIENNSFNSNTYGIFLDSGATGNHITNNTTNSNTNTGIYISASPNYLGSDNTSGSGNTANYNGVDGIYVSGGSGNHLNYNTTQHNGGSGIHLISSSSNTVANNTSTLNTLHGIYLENSLNNNIGLDSTSGSGNTVSSNTGTGIYVSGGSGNHLNYNNTNSNSSTGIHIYNSTGNHLDRNTANLNTPYGIYLDNSGSNILTNNTMLGNISSNFNLFADATYQYNNTIATSNTVEGKPVYYLDGVSNQTYDGNVLGNIGMFWCINCTNVTLKNATLSANNNFGVFFFDTIGSTVDHIIANSNTVAGIYITNGDIEGPSNDNLTNNITNSNGTWGINIQNSTNNTINANTANLNGYYGIQLDNSSYDTITNNIANSNVRWDGIYLFFSSNNTLTNNSVKNNNANGMRIRDASNSNTVTDNIINSNNINGIYIDISHFNNITNNTFYSALSQFAFNQTSNSTGTIFEDNIVYGGKYISVESGSQTSSVYNYNDYYGCSSGCFNWIGTTYDTFANWKSHSSQDANSLNSDPLFTNAATNDFTLQSTSPAIDSGLDVNVNTDYAGHSRYDDTDVINTGSAGSFTKAYVDIGAYEYISAAKAITAFSFNSLSPAVTGTVTEPTHTIALTVPYATNVTALVATFTTTGSSVKVGSTVQVSGTTPNDFTNSVTYTVTAADSTTQNYTVTVSMGLNPAKAITAFSFNGLSPVITATINGTAITATVPYGTDVTTLVPTITITGSSVSPASGAAHNFTSPATYTVTAANSTTQDYTVTVSVGADTTKPILTQVTPVPTPTSNTTPKYTFNSTKAGTITYGGDCSSSTTSAVAGDNTITFDALSVGTHSNCTITVTDSFSNVSNPLSVSSFVVTTSGGGSSSGGGSGGGGLLIRELNIAQIKQQLILLITQLIKELILKLGQIKK